MSKPSTAAGYPPELAIEARRMCLLVTTILGDLLEDIVVVGGLVPYLIIDQEDEAIERHVGTRDLDLGMSLGILDEEQYKQVRERLWGRGFRPGQNEKGNMTRQTWQLPGQRTAIDFLIPPTEENSGARIQNLEPDFAAMVMPALPLAFEDSVTVTIDGQTAAGEQAKRDVRVCGPAGFVGMKAHAFRLRGENKDSYDLIYTLRYHGDGTTQAIADRFVKLLDHPTAEEALAFLEEDFASTDHLEHRLVWIPRASAAQARHLRPRMPRKDHSPSVAHPGPHLTAPERRIHRPCKPFAALGPRRYAEFLANAEDAELQADAYGYAAQFIQAVRRTRA